MQVRREGMPKETPPAASAPRAPTSLADRRGRKTLPSTTCKKGRHRKVNNTLREESLVWQEDGGKQDYPGAMAKAKDQELAMV
jgi:hypothetical protein